MCFYKFNLGYQAYTTSRKLHKITFFWVFLSYSRYENDEGIQYRTLKIIPDLKDKPYQESPQILNYYSMEYRRRGILILVTNLFMPIKQQIDKISPIKHLSMSIKQQINKISHSKEFVHADKATY